MVIDKVIAFYTEEYYIKKDALSAKSWEVTEAYTETLQAIEDAKEKGNEELVKQCNLLAEALTEKLRDIANEEAQLRGEIEQEYINSFNGNIEAILNDISYIVKKIAKVDCEKAIKFRKVIIDAYLKTAEISEADRKIYQSIKQETSNKHRFCFEYILSCIPVQLKALEYYQVNTDVLDKVHDIIALRADTLYPNTTGKQKDKIQIASLGKNPFLTLPTSPALSAIYRAAIYGKDITSLTGKSTRNHGTTYTGLIKNERGKLKVESGKAEITVTFDTTKLSKQSLNLLVHTLTKANEQAIHDGELTKDYISYPLMELVDNGMYTALQSARKGFKTGLDAMTSIKIQGTAKKGNRTEEQYGLEVIFTGGNIQDGECTIYLNPRINWNFVVQYFTVLPEYFFKLNTKAGELLLYIFFIARQRTEAIDKDGYFTINFRAIQEWLNLPSEIGNRKPQQLIRQPIEDAVTQIEEEHSKAFNNEEFTLELVYREGAPISEFLDNGYLKVNLSGAYAKKCIEINNNKKKKIKAQQDKKQRIEEKARAINTAKKMKQEEAH